VILRVDYQLFSYQVATLKLALHKNILVSILFN